MWREFQTENFVLCVTAVLVKAREDSLMFSKPIECAMGKFCVTSPEAK